MEQNLDVNNIQQLVDIAIKVVYFVEDDVSESEVKDLLIKLINNPFDSYFIFKSVKKDVKCDLLLNNNIQSYADIGDKVEKNLQRLNSCIQSLSPNKFNNLKDGFLQKNFPSIFNSNKTKYKEVVTKVREELTQLEFDFIRLKIDISKSNQFVDKNLTNVQNYLKAKGSYLHLLIKTLDVLSNNKIYQYVDNPLPQECIENILYSVLDELKTCCEIITSMDTSMKIYYQLRTRNDYFLKNIDNAINNAKTVFQQLKDMSSINDEKIAILNNLTQETNDSIQKISDEIKEFKQIKEQQPVLDK